MSFCFSLFFMTALFCFSLFAFFGRFGFSLMCIVLFLHQEKRSATANGYQCQHDSQNND
ncbi:hypothetical protein D3C87_2150550 [compost metagenome]